MQNDLDRLLRLSFPIIDIATPMLGIKGKPHPSIFVQDMLHMNGAGYDIWRDAVRAVLIDAEVRYE